MEILLIFEWPNHHNRHQHKPIKNYTSLDFISTHECEPCFLHSAVTSKCTKVTGVKGSLFWWSLSQMSMYGLDVEIPPVVDNQG